MTPPNQPQYAINKDEVGFLRTAMFTDRYRCRKIVEGVLKRKLPAPTTSAEVVICPQSSVCKPGNCRHKSPHAYSKKCKENDDTKCDVCDECQPAPNPTSAEQVLSNLIAWVKDSRDMAQSNIDGDYGTQNDRAVAVILGQVITRYEEFQQQAQQPGGDPP